MKFQLEHVWDADNIDFVACQITMNNFVLSKAVFQVVSLK